MYPFLLLGIFFLYLLFQSIRRHEFFKSPTSYYFVIGAIFKNEAHIMKEWLDHYFFHGVDHVYLIDDGSTDHFLDILQPYIQKKKVTLFYNKESNDFEGRQDVIYKVYFEKELHKSTWWAIVDLDEFLYSPKERNLKKILKKYDKREDISQLTAHWLMFGSSGHTRQPKYVVPNFLMRENNVHPNVKSIFKSKDHVDFKIHVHTVKHDTVEEDSLCVNHYAIQSWEFFKKVKMTRGDAAGNKTVKRDAGYFHAYDNNERKDDRLFQQNKSLYD